MTWRIVETSRGFYAQRGLQHDGGVGIEIGGVMRGFTMPGFMVYEDMRFDARKEAEAHIRSKLKDTRYKGDCYIRR